MASTVEVKTNKEAVAAKCAESGKCVKDPTGLVVYNSDLVTDKLILKQNMSEMSLATRLWNLIDEPKLLKMSEKIEPLMRGVTIVKESEPCDSPNAITGLNPTVGQLRELKEGRYKACIAYVGEGLNRKTHSLDPIDVDTTGPQVSPDSVTVSSETYNSATISWSKAGDNVTLEGDLSYYVYLSTSDLLQSLDAVHRFGTAQPGKVSGVTSYAMKNLREQTTYHGAVVVRDEAGNETLVGKANFTTLASDTSPPTSPSIAINGSATHTNTQSVTLTLGAVGADLMYITNTAECASGGAWEPYGTLKSWSLSQANTTATVYVKFKDTIGNATQCISNTIIHDNSAPTGSVTINNGDAVTDATSATLSLTISAAEANDSTRQMYVTSTAECSSGGNWENYSSTTSWTLTQTDNLNSVFVKFKDAAGNESPCYSDSITHDSCPYTFCGLSGNSCYDNATALNAEKACLTGKRPIELVAASGGFKVWREKNGTRILKPDGLWASDADWQKNLNRAGTAHTASSFTAVSSIAGRACPPSVFLSPSNMTASNQCLYYDTGNPSQGLNAAEGSGIFGEDYLSEGNNPNSGNGTAKSWYEGNIKTCADKTMRLPTVFESGAGYFAAWSHQYPTDANPNWADTASGVPAAVGGSNATASSAGAFAYWKWGGAPGSSSYDSGFRIRCVLPGNYFPTDSTAPASASVIINNNNEYTNSTSPYAVTLTLYSSDADSGITQMYITDSSGCSTGGAWETYATTKSWNLNQNNTTAAVYAKFRDAAGNESACINDTIIHDNTAPTAPNVTGITPTSSTTPTWSWTNGGSGGNGTYRYKLNSTNLTTGATETTSTSFTPGSALTEGAHTLYVQERDAAGNWSTSGSLAIQVVTPPAAPTLSTPSRYTTSLGLSWSSVNGATAYNLYWSTSAGVTTASTKISSVSSPYTHSPLTGGTTYYYKVAAVKSGIEGSLSNEVSASPYAFAAPTVTSISPNTGSTAGNTSVTLTGTGFQSGATITIGGVSATNVVFMSDTSIIAKTPSGSAGAKDVVLTNPDSQTGTLTGGFTYTSPPPSTPEILIGSPVELLTVSNCLSCAYRMTANIDMNGVTWTPVDQFTGTFDGAGFLISNLSLTTTTTYAGLFGRIAAGGIVRNVHVRNISINSSGTFAGGIAGYIADGGMLLDSSSTGNITLSTAASTDANVGGLAGGVNGNVRRSWSSVNVSATGNNYCHSGGAFALIAASATVSDIYATGTAYSTCNIGNIASGGLIGTCLGKIINSYSTGASDNLSHSHNEGGMVGFVSGCTTTSSFWNTTTSGRTTSKSGTGLTDTQMKTMSNFSGWDFTGTWEMQGGDGIGMPQFKTVSSLNSPANVLISGNSSTSATLSLYAPTSTEMYITNTAGCTSGGNWEAFNNTKSWTLVNAGDSTGTVYARFRNGTAISRCVSHRVALSGSLSSEGTSCSSIKAAGAKRMSGVYLIDPDGAGSLAAENQFCHMDYAGGGWTLITKTFADNADITNTIPSTAEYRSSTSVGSLTGHKYILGNDRQGFANWGAMVNGERLNPVGDYNGNLQKYISHVGGTTARNCTWVNGSGEFVLATTNDGACLKFATGDNNYWWGASDGPIGAALMVQGSPYNLWTATVFAPFNLAILDGADNDYCTIMQNGTVTFGHGYTCRQGFLGSQQVAQSDYIEVYAK
jgi:hypothetical protein